MCISMHVRFEAVPGLYLPRHETAALLTGESEAVYLLNRDEPLHRLAAALTSLTNDWVREEWLHLGPPVEILFESVAPHVAGRRAVSLVPGAREVLYLLGRDAELDRVCAVLTAVVNEYREQEWLHVSAFDGLRDFASR